MLSARHGAGTVTRHEIVRQLLGHRRPRAAPRGEVPLGLELLDGEQRRGAGDPEVAGEGPRRGQARPRAYDPVEGRPPDAPVDLLLETLAEARVDPDQEARGGSGSGHIPRPCRGSLDHTNSWPWKWPYAAAANWISLSGHTRTTLEASLTQGMAGGRRWSSSSLRAFPPAPATRAPWPPRFWTVSRRRARSPGASAATGTGRSATRSSSSSTRGGRTKPPSSCTLPCPTPFAS